MVATIELKRVEEIKTMEAEVEAGKEASMDHAIPGEEAPHHNHNIATTTTIKISWLIHPLVFDVGQKAT